MHIKINLLLSVLFCTLIFTAMPSLAQDIVKVSPKHTKVLINNDKVRVLDYQSKPGDKEPMHSHPDMLIYVLEGGTTLSTPQSGKPETTEFKTGEIYYRKAMTHTAENVGKTRIHFLLVEIKDQGKK